MKNNLNLAQPDWNASKKVEVLDRIEAVKAEAFNKDEYVDKYMTIYTLFKGSAYRNETNFCVRRAINGNRCQLEMRINRNGDMTPRLVINPSKVVRTLSNLMEYGIELDSSTLKEFKKKLTEEWKNIPIRLVPIKVGFNLDINGEISSFRSGITVGKDGSFYKNEPEDALPRAKGCMDISTLTKVLKNKKRRLIVLHGLIAPLVGIASIENSNESNPILLITGDSSTGKTTMARYGQSLSIDPLYGVTSLDFDSTEKYLLKMLGQNFGIIVMIDDTSLGLKTDYKRLIYSLANQAGRTAIGQEYGRSGTSIVLTSERNIIYSVPADYKGIHARIFSLEIKDQKDLFENSDMVREVEQSTNDNHGQLLPVIVSWMFKKTLPKVKEMVEFEKEKIAATYKETDNIVTRWYRYFAYMKVVAMALEDELDIKVNVEEVIQYMIDEIKLTLMKRSTEETNEKLKEVFWELYRRSVKKEGSRYIYCKYYKEIVKPQLNDLQLHYGEVANRLERMGLLEMENGTLYPNINGVRCYKLKIVDVLEKSLEGIEEEKKEKKEKMQQ